MKAVKTFNGYQNRTVLTASYPEKNAERYLYSGLVEECAEVLGKYAKRYRGDYIKDFERFRRDIKKELGDVIWFVAQVSLINRIKLGRVTERNKIDDYVPDINFVNKNEADIAHELVKLATVIYDGNFTYYISDHESAILGLRYQLGEIVARVFVLAKENGFGLVEILNANLEKLQDRKKRNVIKGSGDER